MEQKKLDKFWSLKEGDILNNKKIIKIEFLEDEYSQDHKKIFTLENNNKYLLDNSGLEKIKVVVGHQSYNESWNLDKTSLEYIKQTIKKNNLKLILEIGTYNALTTISFSEISKDIKVTTIEIDKEFIKIAKENIEKNKIKNIILMGGDAKEILKQLKEQNQTFDLIFIDARKSEYKEYLIQSLKLIKRGFIYIDNTISHKAKLTDFFNYLKESKLNWKELNLGKGLIEIKV